MSLIWYDIHFLYIIVFFLIVSLFSMLRKNHKIRNKIKKKRYLNEYNRRKKLSIILLCALFMTILYTGYLSLDLVLCDYITCEAILTHKSNRPRRATWNIGFELNEKYISVQSWSSDIKKYDLREGEHYRITYSKRTKMLLSAEKIDEDEKDFPSASTP